MRRLQVATRSSLRDYQTLDYVLMVLSYHRPGFDDLPSKERANLVADACAHTNAVLEALRKLVIFLEHGRHNYRGPAAIKVASRDITAAVLRDVDSLTNRGIGERLCSPAHRFPDQGRPSHRAQDGWPRQEGRCIFIQGHKM